MEDVRIVKVIHQEDAPVESERWMRRLITEILLKQIRPNPKDMGRLLQVELEEVDGQSGD